MKHYHIVNRFRFTVFVVTLILTMGMITGLVFGSFNASGETRHSYETITIQYGDTMWSLAEQYAPADQDIRDYIYEICDKNNIKAGELTEGQEILIPVAG